jgi:hypothetical protein
VKDNLPIDTVLYTTSVVNTPSRVDTDISLAKERVRNILLDPIQQEARIVLDEIRLKDEKRRRDIVALYLTCRPRFVCFQQLACCTKPVDTAFNL